jgi:hypothetical protein
LQSPQHVRYPADVYKEETLLTAREAADLLRLTPARVRQLCATGRLAGAVRRCVPGGAPGAWLIPWRAAAACLQTPAAPIEVRPARPAAGWDPLTVARARQMGWWEYVRQG